MEGLQVLYLLRNKDVQILLGVSRNTASRILSLVRRHVGKGEGQLVSLGELCRYEQLDVQAAYVMLNGR